MKLLLADLPPGGCGRLCDNAEKPPRARLRDLGFVPGTRVAVIRRGPLGDPIELELRGYRICLRRRDLAGVHVTPLEAEG